jgi:hypothetical protein
MASAGLPEKPNIPADSPDPKVTCHDNDHNDDADDVKEVHCFPLAQGRKFIALTSAD